MRCENGEGRDTMGVGRGVTSGRGEELHGLLVVYLSFCGLRRLVKSTEGNECNGLRRVTCY